MTTFKQRAFKSAMLRKREEKNKIKTMFVDSGNCKDLIDAHHRLHEDKKKIDVSDLPF